MTIPAPAAPALPDDLEAVLRRLRLAHIRWVTPELLATARSQRWEPAEVLGKTFSSWDETACSIPAPTQAALRSLEWVARPENLVVCGPGNASSSKPWDRPPWRRP